MMDYKQWVEDALEFTRNLSKLPGELEVTCEAAPPLTLEELASIAGKFTGGVPGELARFWTEGSAHLSCSYWWEPPGDEMPAFRKVFPFGDFLWGGANFCPTSFINPQSSAAVEARVSHDAVDERIEAIVGNFRADLGAVPEPESSGQADPHLPFVIHLPGNGDRLALNPNVPGADPEDPPVVLWRHELEDAKLVAHRFTTFLQTWRQWSFLGIDRLGWWPATNNPGMEPNGEKALALRALLRRA